MVKLIGGRAGSKKSDRLLQMVKAEAEKGNKRIVITVPEQFTVMQERELLNKLGNRLADGIEVLSFRRLCSFIMSKTGGAALPHISDGGKFLLMNKAYEAVSDKITTYKRIGSYTDFITGLVALCDEFRTYDVDYEKINEKFEGRQDALACKMRDLALIFETYGALLGHDMSDSAEDIDKAAQALENNVIFEGYSFYFDEFKSFSPQQRKLLERILGQAENAVFFFAADDFSNRDELCIFHAAGESAGQISRICARIGADKPTYEYLPVRADAFSPEIAHIEKNIYLPRPEKYDGECGDISVVSAGTEFEELEFIASDIRRKIIDNGYKYSDFAIITRNLDSYKNVIASVFERYGIPVFLDRRADVLSMPLATLVFSAFDCVLYGYRYRDVMSYLKSGITGMSLEEADEIDNYAFSWGISGGAWKKPWTRHPDGAGREFSDGDRQRLDRLNELRQRTVGVLESFEKALKTDSEKEIAAAVYNMLVGAEVPKHIGDTVNRLDGDNRKYEAAQYSQLWKKLMEALDQTVLVCTEAIKPEKYAKLLRQMLSCAEIGTIPTAVDEVLAGSAERVRASEIKCSYLIGFNAGEFPQGSFAEGLITDSEKRELRGLEIELAPDSSMRAFDERYFVYCALTSASEKLVMTYPKSDGKGGAKRKSYVVSILREMFPKLKERFLDEEPGKEIFNRADALEYMLSNKDRLSEIIGGMVETGRESEFADRVRKSLRLDRKKLRLACGDEIKSLYRSDRFSSTKFDTYAKCPFMYFCKYGLKLKPRKEYGFDNIAIGNFMHYVLEKYVAESENFGGGVDRERVLKHIDDFKKEELPEYDALPERGKAAFGRMTDEICGYIEALDRELADCLFRPVGFELEIGDGGIAPIVLSDGDRVEGRIDRLDAWEKDGEVFVRVVDYKTGGKALDFEELYNGMGMQMLIYLFAVGQNGQDYFGKKIRLAGVLYSPVKYGYVNAESRHISDEKCEQLHFSDNPSNGLLISDKEVLSAMDTSGKFARLPVSFLKNGELSASTGKSVASESDFEQLGKFILKKTEELEERIRSGDISVSPYRDDAKPDRYVSCRYCEMRSVCRYERDGRLDREAVGMSAEDFWKKIREEAR